MNLLMVISNADLERREDEDEKMRSTPRPGDALISDLCQYNPTGREPNPWRLKSNTVKMSIKKPK